MANGLSSEKVKEYGLNAGASVVGIAASKDFDSAPDGYKPGDGLKGCLSVVVFGAAFPREAMTQTKVEYTDHRKAMIEKINGIAESVEKQIKGHGHKARVVYGFGGKWVKGEQHGLISLKHAAELAGLGTIGRNHLLTSPEYGNLLWLSAVLTTADLIPDKRSQFSFCDGCNICIEVCPMEALNDPDSFGKKGCSKIIFKMVDGRWEVQCYQCRKMCPHRFGSLG